MNDRTANRPARAATDVAGFVAALPKAELHLHIEGTFEPDLMFAIAERNGVRLPYASVEEVRAAYSFSSLQDFLDIYYAGASVLIEEQDFHDLAWAYLTRAHADAVRHVEIFFDPQTHTARGVPFATVVGGIGRALDDAEARFGLTSRLIMCFLRHLDEAAAFDTLDAAWTTAIGSPGSGSTPRSAATRRASSARCSAAPAPPACARSPTRERKAPRSTSARRWTSSRSCGSTTATPPSRTTTSSPTSCAGACPSPCAPSATSGSRVVDDMAAHPLKRMLDRGLFVTVNSDDPAYFGGYVNDNYVAAAEALGLDRSHLVQLARNSFDASWLDGPAKAARLAELDAAAAASNPR